MNFLKNIFFSRRFVRRGTEIILKLSKNEPVSTELFETIKKNSGFTDTKWTKNKNTDIISFETKNLITVSSYIKKGITQDEYTSLVIRITDTAKLLTDAGFSLTCLAADPELSFVDPSDGTLHMICIPSLSDFRCTALPEYLKILNNNAQITVTDGRKLNEYRKLLQSADTKEQNFIAEIKKILTGTAENHQVRSDADTELIIKESDDITSDLNSEASAYLTDKNGNRYYIDHVPFTIGRKKNSDLRLSDIPEVSGTHARIIIENDSYMIEDMNSTNGTFINKSKKSQQFSEDCRIKKEILSEGTVFCIYHIPFTFFSDNRSSQTCIVSEADDYQTSPTVLLGTEEHTESDNYIAYITSHSDGVTAYIYAFPFSSDNFPGTVLENISDCGSFSCRISNISADTLTVEDDPVHQGNSAVLFSGCNFTINSKDYTFYIKR